MTDFPGLFDSIEDDPSAAVPPGALFDADMHHGVFDGPDDTDPGGIVDPLGTSHGDPSTDEDDDNSSDIQTIQMTSFFIAFMVLYVAFCCYYRRVKDRRSVGADFDGRGNNSFHGNGSGSGRESAHRRRQRRENQEVLDESTTATSRARDSASEQAKLEERKGRIREALLLRLIVDDDEEEEEEGEGNALPRGGEDDAIEVMEGTGDRGRGGFCASDDPRDCEWGNSDEDSNKVAADYSKTAAAAIPSRNKEGDCGPVAKKSSAVFASARRRIIAIREEDSDHENEEGLDGIAFPDEALDAKAAVKGHDDDDDDDVEAQNANVGKAHGLETSRDGHDDNEMAVQNAATIDAIATASSEDNRDDDDIEAQNNSDVAKKSNVQPSSPVPSSHGMLAAAPPPPSSPSRLSLASPKRYTDALLNCGNGSRMSCSSSSNALSNCASPGGANCGDVHRRAAVCGSKKFRCGSGGNVGPNHTPTVYLSTILASYGEECNICLSSFQVGDRAAWSRLREDEEAGGGNKGEDVEYRGVVIAGGGGEKEAYYVDDGNNAGRIDPGTDLANDDPVETDSNDDASGITGGRCTHVFHEECISRWLLVRDGCPICRRSYFPAEESAERAGRDDDGGAHVAAAVASADANTAARAAGTTAPAPRSSASASSARGNGSGAVAGRRDARRRRNEANTASGTRNNNRVDLTGSWW
eukprot:CAMPEP_0181113860 /NCGR_PEP_ID=MMETSP1071-20121207/20572_1 /TAXON_ID=35127 /ORGANISM="Thalassiosira sp., Strain NH16" /LENGTH=697 /DNA_ID=CAMNT_0023197925 /DNA_START=98 /DNA_END=2191 /DNA_ORIENTATION=+